MNRRFAVALAAVAVLAGAMPAASAEQRRAAPVAFGTTTFSSTNGSATAFTLSRPSTLVRAPGHQLRDVTINGGGRVAGIVLAREGADAESGAVLYAMRFNGCWSRGCTTPRDERLFPWGYAEARDVPSVRRDDGSTLLTLPAGRYTAYVVADGAPVKVTVRFNGERGTGTLRPDRAASLRLTTATSQVPGGTVYSAGAAGELRSSLGLLVGVMEARLTMNVSSDGGTCFYRDAQPPGGTFVSGCPFGTSEPAIVVNGVTPMHRGVTSMLLEQGDRDGVPWTLGNYFDGAYAAEWLSPSVFLWLDLD